MDDEIPGYVYTAIRLALEFNLRDYYRRWPDNLATADLYVDIITAIKWVHVTNPDLALYLVQAALTNASAYEDGPPMEDAAACLRHSLTQESRDRGPWTPEQAQHFVGAALTAD